MESVSVFMSGASLSFLLHDTMKTSLVQLGFLLGETIEKKTSTITDNEQRQVKISKEIHITSSLSLLEPCLLYNPSGRVNRRYVEELLGKQGQNKVVGWYVFKPHNTQTSLSFRETIVHKQLSQMFKIPFDLFCCCLLTQEHSDNRSTHTLCQTFVRHYNHSTETIPVHIINVSDPNNGYKTPNSKVSESFRKLVAELQLDNNLSNGLGCVTQLQQAMQKKTDQMTGEVARLEDKLFQLEKDLYEIERRRIMNDVIDPEEEQFEEKKEVVMNTSRGRRTRNRSKN